MSNLKYSNQIYEVKFTRYPKNRRYRVQLIKNPDIHTHVRTLKEAIDLANYAKHKHIPERAKVDYLHSLYRILIDEELKSKVQSLIDNQLQRKELNNESSNDDNLSGGRTTMPTRILR